MSDLSIIEVEDDEPMPMTILGQTLGTATGWDQAGSWDIFFYNPKFNDKAKKLFQAQAEELEQATVFSFDFEEGTASIEVPDGTVDEAGVPNMKSVNLSPIYWRNLE